MWWQPLRCLSFCGFSTSGGHQLLELCRGGGFAGQQTSWVPLLLGKGCWHKRGVPSRGGGGSTETYIWDKTLQMSLARLVVLGCCLSLLG